LSVEEKDLTFPLIKKAFQREIFYRAIQVFANCGILDIFLADDKFLLEIPNKMMVLQERCIKEIYENFCFGNKSARNERVLEIIDWNRSIFKTHYLIDLQIAFFNFLFSSSIFSKSTKSEKTIFLISRCKMGSVEILFDVFYFYAIFRLFFSELFLEFQIEILEAVTLDK
jgi:hypothetical protein